MKTYKKINRLWTNGYYDGPLSGMCEIDGEMFYFNIEKNHIKEV